MALFVLLGTFVVLFILAFGVATLSRNEVRLTSAFVEGEIAFQIAEAGLEQGLFLLKKDLESNRALARAMVDVEPTDLNFEAADLVELGALAPPGGETEVEVWGRYEPVDEVGTTGRVGSLILHSRGKYLTPQGETAIRQLRVAFKVSGEDLSPVAPDHGLLIRDRRSMEYYVEGLTLDARDFQVYGGAVYVNGGIGIELTESIINKEFRPMGELGLLDLGYDAWNLVTLFQGGINLTHSRRLEVGHPNAKLTRKYFDFQGLDDLFGPGPAWRATEEKYLSQVRRAPGGEYYYDDERINLRSPEEYKRLASTVIEPRLGRHLDGDARQNVLFRDVLFPGPLGFRNTVYPKVLPLYGWGDWRRLRRLPYSNPTRRNDLSAAIQLDGITYVRGDVFLEGWYEGVGTLVVEGNVYVGGDVVGLPPTVTGYQSFLNLVVMQDPVREGVMAGTPKDRRTGKIIYRPHHDTDFDSRGLLGGRDTTPFLDVAIYSQNGLEVDRTSIFDKFFNMEIEFNFAADLWEFGRLPNDVRINGTDPKDVFRFDPAMRRFGVSPFFVPVISSEAESWEEETPRQALPEEDEDEDEEEQES
jgi:hypothetical protein